MNSKKRLCALIGLFLALSAHLYGQNIVQKADSLYAAIFEPTKGLVLEFKKDHYIRFNPLTRQQEVLSATGIGEMTLNHDAFLIADTLYLVKSGSGPVYKVMADSMVRIDRSIDHNVMQGAATFVHRDTIYRFGGHNDWHTLANLVYFDRFTHEWEVFRPMNSTEFPPGMWNNIIHAHGDSVFIFGGYTMNPKDPLMKVANPDIWLCDLGRKRWTNLGPIHTKLEFEKKFNSMQQFPNGKHEEIFSKSSEELIRLDFEQNTFSIQPFPDQRIHIIGGKRFHSFLLGDHYYYFSTYEAVGRLQKPVHVQPCLLQSIAASELLIPAPATGNIYPQQSSWYPIFFLLPVAGLLLFFLYRRRRKNSSAKLEAGGISLNGQHHPLDPKQVLLLKRLKENPDGISTNDVLGLLGLSDQDYSTNIRNKNSILTRLNLELRGIFHADEDIIVEIRSNEDKRIKKYILRDGLFN